MDARPLFGYFLSIWSAVLMACGCRRTGVGREDANEGKEGGEGDQLVSFLVTLFPRGQELTHLFEVLGLVLLLKAGERESISLTGLGNEGRR